MQFRREPDEIKQYLDARYISAPEAAWHLFGMCLHEEVPNIVRLALHLPGIHQVIFDPEDEAAEILFLYSIEEPTDEQIYDYGLFLINEILRSSNYSLAMCPSMPLWVHNWELSRRNRLIAKRLACNVEELRVLVENHILQLNSEQNAA
ncbi:6033_t:CDS:2 [Cetraspora pellucida]|uniref:6033_t:CDS:1 n=1 Tax=Cetraspora pellucida TaxID=1433469 RepID=A0ACA9Q2F0_9GLOM|nr:6033_t:CDS:2 [Cetraspora pellucida]